MATDTSLKKSLGAYYTPDWLADLMVEWAVRTPNDRVLDPSFGGCAFLRAALNCEVNRTSRRRGGNVFGIDIDPAAFRHVAPLLKLGLRRENVVFGDFFDSKIRGAIGCFDAVVGNPPFIRHHAMTKEWLQRAQSFMLTLGVDLPRQASAWAYFAIAASSVLSTDGRLALVLPATLLHADYGGHVLRYFEDTFASVRIIRVRERLFADTAEQVVLVLASRQAANRTGTEVVSVGAASEIVDAITCRQGVSLPLNHKKLDIPPRIIEAYERIKAQASLVSLGAVADVVIGVVTGANNFFVRDRKNEIFSSRLVDAIPIVTTSSWLSNRPILLAKHFYELDRRGVPTRLAIIKGTRAGVVLNEIKRGCREKFHLRHHCSLRDPWYRITDCDVPHAFLGYMGQRAPSLVKNGAGALSTNAVHRLFFKQPEVVGSVVSSALTSLFAFEAELFGRHYGGGILKIEPSAAKKLSVDTSLDLLKDVSLFDNPVERRRLADIAFARHWGINAPDLALLAEGELLLREARARPPGRSVSQGEPLLGRTDRG